jgi:glycosyltransferase involved in cell wall biosynthesis
MNETLKPIITTIIPTYRRPKLLKRAINSVLKQTYPHFVVCIYDNASGDDTASVVAEIAKADPRVKYYCHAENIGAFKNFQYGLEHVETPFFNFLSDDDVILPDFYETALAGFEGFPEAVFSATDVIYVGIQHSILGTALEIWTPGFYRPPDGLIAVLEQGYFHWIGTLFRKTVTDNIGFFDLDIWCFDLDFTQRIAAHYPFVVSKRPCAVYNQTPYLRLPFDMLWPGWLKMIRNLTEDKSLTMDVRAYAERVLLRNFDKRLFATGLGYLCRGDIADAKKAAALIRDQFGKFAQYRALSALINTYKYVPFARLAFRCLIVCHRYVLAKRIKIKQKQYRNLRKYLD